MSYPEAVATAYAALPATRPSLLPQKLRHAAELYRLAPFYAIPLVAELEWATQLACHAHGVITSFRREVPSLQEAFFRSDAVAAECSLVRIAQVAGESSWLIEARIACLQAHEGLAAQRAYVQSVSASLGATLLRPIVYFVGQRNEELVSMHRFVSRVEQTLADWRLPDPLDGYLQFKLVGLAGASHEQLAGLLRVAATGSIIDLYETLIDMLTLVIVSGGMGAFNLGSAVPAMLERLSGRIDDPRLASMRRLAMNAVPPSGASVSRRVETRLRTVVASARATGGSKEAPPVDLEARLTSHLRAIFHRTGEAASSAQELVKFSLNHQFLAESPFLLLAATDARTASPSALRTIARIYAASEPSPEWHGAAVRAGDITDAVAFYDLDYSNPTHPLAAVVGGTDFPGSAHCQIERDIESGDFATAAALTEAVYERGDDFDRLQLVRQRFAMHKRCGDWWTAVTLAVDQRIERSGFRAELPLCDILDEKSWTTLREREADPRLSVAIHMAITEHAQASDSGLHAMLRQALRSLLRSHRVTSYAELTGDQLGVSDTLLIFLLRYVCVESNLQGIPGIDNSKDLARERVRICQRLRTLDPGHPDIYDEETRKLTYRLELEEGVASFDRSRVFVNLEGIRSWAKRALQEDLLRYQSLIDVNSDALAALQDAIAKIRGNAPLPDALLQQPTSDADKLLVDMVRRLREQYLSSPEDGLDVFLSLRIRHGSLSGNLRGPLEEESLLTLKDETDGQYRPNLVWADRLRMVGTPEEAMLHAAFDKFSQTFDAAVNHIIRDVVQVRSKEKPEGAFDISVSLLMINVLKSEITRATTFEEFVSSALQLFGLAMDGPLHRTQQALQETFKAAVEEAFKTLRMELSACVPPSAYANVSMAVGRASTHVAAAIDRVADWFAPDPMRDRSRLYSVQDLVEMGIQITRNTHRGFAPEAEVNVAADLPPFTMSTGAIVVLDVLIILLDNVFRRSGIPVAPKVELNVSMPDAGHLEFHMVNEVAKGVRTPAVDARLEKIRETIASESPGKAAALEGGSGFIKLKRIGNARSGARTAVSFGFSSDLSFEVRVAIPVYTEIEEVEAT